MASLFQQRSWRRAGDSSLLRPLLTAQWVDSLHHITFLDPHHGSMRNIEP